MRLTILLFVFILFFYSLFLINNNITFYKTYKKTIIEEIDVSFPTLVNKFRIYNENPNNVCELYLDGKKINFSNNNKKYKEYLLSNYIDGKHKLKMICEIEFREYFNIFKIKENKFASCEPFDLKKVNIDIKDFFKLIEKIKINPNNIDYYDDRQIVRENPLSVLKFKKGTCGGITLLTHDVLCSNNIDNSVEIGFIDGDKILYHSWIRVYKNIRIDPTNKRYYFVGPISYFYTLDKKMLKIGFEDNGERWYSITPILFANGFVDIRNERIFTES